MRAFCEHCPDHEACSTGAPCGVVKSVFGATLVAQERGSNDDIKGKD